MKIVRPREARQNREDIWIRIAQDNVVAAADMDERFERAAERLVEHPLSGRTGVISGTRETFPHNTYRLVYEVAGDQVEILALVHTARQWPPLPEDPE